MATEPPSAIMGVEPYIETECLCGFQSSFGPIGKDYSLIAVTPESVSQPEFCLC